MKIFKLSHGNLTADNYDQSIIDQRAVVSYGINQQNEPYQQGVNFEKAANGSIFYLCHPGTQRISLIGKLMDRDGDPRNIYGINNRYCRKYEVIFKSNDKAWDNTNFKLKWSPSGNSTFHQVPSNELKQFEEIILKPFFDKSLNDLENSIRNSNENMPNTQETYDNASPASQVSKQSINTIYYGPPGTGKTKKLISDLKEIYNSNEEKEYEFVTFHQSYGYEEFVEGIKPVLSTDATDNGSSGSVSYKIEDGVFKKLCKTAEANPDKRYAMVIDEINRGNISKIFGELITLIEPSKRIGGDEYVPVTLPYSGEEFGVPPNLDIYGSMNTADRSLALLDTALRRRFNFVAVYPDASTLEDVTVYENGKDVKIDLQMMLEVINQRIEALYDRDHTIGHGYFLAECEDGELKIESLQNIFKEKIIPLLEEYFFEDKAKIALVLGDGTKAKTSEFRFYNEVNIDFGNLFGNHIESGHTEQKTAFALNLGALIKVESYIGIYQATAA